jgi:hypothetical protein
VLLELFTILGTYRDSLVLIGGWVPYFLLETRKKKDDPFQHIGSIDIDIAVEPEKVPPKTYASIVELIQEKGYKLRESIKGEKIHYSFNRTITSPYDDKEYTVGVDFLTIPESETQAKKHRHRKVQPDLLARISKGYEIVFKHNFQYRLTGILPDNGENSVDIKIADIVSLLATKGILLGERFREKDAYDLFSVIRHYKDGPKSVAEKISPFLKDETIKEAIDNIKDKFEKIDSAGPSWVAKFLYPAKENGEARKRIQAEAYVTFREFFEQLKV